MKTYWFKAKNYGWGWYPSTWQGWVIILAYCAAITKIFLMVDVGTFPIAAVLTMLLILICYRTGEKPEWRWGPKTKKRSS